MVTSFAWLLINFLLSPSDLKKLYIDVFLNRYGWTLPIVFMFTTISLMVGIISGSLQKNRDKQIDSQLTKIRDELLEDELALVYLNKLLDAHPNACELPFKNQKVILLERYELIVRVSSQQYIFNWNQLSNPTLPYVLQPIAEHKLKNKNQKM